MGAISERRVMSNTLRRYDVLATTANGNSAVLDITKNGSGSTVIGEFISVAYSVTTRVGVPGGCTLVATNGSTDTLEIDAFSTGTTPTIDSTNGRAAFSVHLIGPKVRETQTG
jgi:hypothetical protein